MAMLDNKKADRWERKKRVATFLKRESRRSTPKPQVSQIPRKRGGGGRAKRGVYTHTQSPKRGNVRGMRIT
jgi:hypothetical protein